MFNEENLLEQITDNFEPEKIILFGSYAKGSSTSKSDIDLCIVMHTDDKRKTTTELYYKVEHSLPIDFLLYTPNEWNECISDSTSFAHKINSEGVLLYARQ